MGTVGSRVGGSVVCRTGSRSDRVDRSGGCFEMRRLNLAYLDPSLGRMDSGERMYGERAAGRSAREAGERRADGWRASGIGIAAGVWCVTNIPAEWVSADGVSGRVGPAAADSSRTRSGGGRRRDDDDDDDDDEADSIYLR